MKKPLGGIKGALPIRSSGRWNLMDRFAGRLFSPIVASGGDTVADVQIGGILYRIHVFTTVGSSQAFEVQTLGTSEARVDCLIVAGGGGGDSRHQGGGGAGGVVFKENVSAFVANYPVVVGNGGIGESANLADNSTNGGNSSVFGLTALGGGAASTNGGSGGGGFSTNIGLGLQPTLPSGGFGNDGGTGTSGNPYAAGGGGGAGGPGGTTTSYSSAEADGGDGGPGKDYSAYFGTSFGENGWFGGGGGGGGDEDGRSVGGQGGIGGGGNGYGNDTSSPGYPTGDDGLPNTGGGGGGAAFESGVNFKSGDGGSGIVIIRYPLVPV